MLKKLILLLLVIAPVAMFAQDKIAYINSSDILAVMPELKEVETKLANKRETVTKRLAAIEQEYQKKLEEFRGDTTELSPSVIQDRQNQIENLDKRYQEYAQSSSTEFEQERQTLIAPLKERLRKAIKEVGDENNYTYILDLISGAVVHMGSNAIDANQQVKNKLGITN